MLPNIILACVLTALGGYLLGSILFGVLISKVMYNDDVRDHGSGNAGMTNVLRTYGKLPAVLPPLATLAKAWPPSTWDASSSMPCFPARALLGRTRWTLSVVRIWPPSSA